MFDRGLFIFHQKSNVEFRGQLLLIKNSEFDNFGLVRFLRFLAFHWHINCKIWISFDWSIWRFPLRCSFRGFSDIWFSIIHSKSHFLSKNHEIIYMNKFHFLSSFQIYHFRNLLTLFDSLILQYTYCWSKSTPWLWLLTFLFQTRELISSNFLLVYLYHFHSLHLIFTSLKPLLNLSLTKSTLLSMDRPDTYTLLDFLYLIFVSSVL